MSCIIIKWAVKEISCYNHLNFKDIKYKEWSENSIIIKCTTKIINKAKKDLKFVSKSIHLVIYNLKKKRYKETFRGAINVNSFDCDDCFTGILKHTEELGLGKVNWNGVSENILKLIIVIVAPSCEYTRKPYTNPTNYISINLLQNEE